MNLISEIKKLAEVHDLDIGVAINYIEKAEEFIVDADSLYYFASVIKIPIMVEAFRQIEVEKTLTLDERIILQDSFKLSGSGILKFLNEGLSITVQDLITLMIIISDNTATDMLLERLGGPHKVDETMKALGLNDIHVNTTIRQGHWDRGTRKEPLVDPREAKKAREELKLIFTSTSYQVSPKGNSTSPRAMTNLLCKIYNGELWSRNACDNMINIMYKQQLNTRIPSKLPVGTLVAHKTGTITGVANDAGIIEIDEENHVALSIFTRDKEFMKYKDSKKAREKKSLIESVMGDIALSTYNYGKKLFS